MRLFYCKIVLLLIFSVIIIWAAQKTSISIANQSVTTAKPVILKKLKHDPSAFTQGLFFFHDTLYESTGIHGKSTIRLVDTLGNVLKASRVPDVFAEGCALLNGTIYQLTWQEGICITYNVSTLNVTGSLHYQGEGWGLTSDGTILYMSNGSDTVTVRDSRLAVLKRIPVTINGQRLTNINEMEFAQGKLYVNVWFNDSIFVVNISSGKVEKVIDCRELAVAESSSDQNNVLNGIAYDKSSNVFYITGKNWNSMYKVKF